MHTHDTHQERTSVTRRRFFTVAGWSSFTAFFGGTAVATGRFFFPKILYEPSPQFLAGKPEDYQVGKVSTRFKKAQRVWMIRTSEGIYALIAICTHLGCTPIWFGNEQRFKCPCHGSVFLLDGTNVAGPAPVPLYRATIALDLNGNLVVNKALQENRPDRRARPPFFLPLPGAGSSSA
jgi:cytochrome b6-f complex iron-sulfur subunit